ncbi:hypothetical protein NP493_390g00002 [Ridgeia piscesae]|uniref:Cytochrome c oxidase polypeptide II n=1 Tax=Ridgeia piscesae TaxID=27915 RepID=A0AAD9L2J5_RIDPI|nr:hypothetical protein NP493_390g00002 [Ridgeia piscesae]
MKPTTTKKTTIEPATGEPTTADVDTTSSSPDAAPATDTKTVFTTTVIVAIVIGVLVFIVLVCLVVHCKRKSGQGKGAHDFETNHTFDVGNQRKSETLNSYNNPEYVTYAYEDDAKPDTQEPMAGQNDIEFSN